MAYVKQKTENRPETGKWIPKLISGTHGAAIHLSPINCRYVKNGAFVFLTFDMTVANLEQGDPASIVMLEGLPFKVEGRVDAYNSGEYFGSVIVSYFKNLNTKISYITGSVIKGSYACDLWYEKSSGYSLQQLQRSEIKIGSRFQGTIAYISDER